MINVHIYGFLKKKIDPTTSLSGDMILTVPFKESLTLKDIFQYLKITNEDCGDCFLNGIVIRPGENPFVSDESRVAIFSEGMYLLCGGQHLKGHGFITKSAPKDYDYFHLKKGGTG